MTDRLVAFACGVTLGLVLPFCLRLVFDALAHRSEQRVDMDSADRRLRLWRMR